MKESLLKPTFMPHGHCWEPYTCPTISDSIAALFIALFRRPCYGYLKRKDLKYVWMMGLFAILFWLRHYLRTM